MSEHVCYRCREPINPGAQKCPHCSYRGVTDSPHAMWNGVRIGALAMMITVIGLPFGLPIWLFAKWKLGRAKKRGEFGSPVMEVSG